MEFIKAVDLKTARELVQNKLDNFKFETHSIGILSAVGKITVKDIVSNEDVPSFNRATVDGYAVKSSDTFGASESVPSFLNLIGEVKMGEETSLFVKSGEAVYVPTGGMIPSGADSMVMIENTDMISKNEILVNKACSPSNGIIFKGDDIKENSVIIKKAHRITSFDVGALSAVGKSEIEVYKPVKFYIISTGDEVIDIDKSPNIGQIRDVNSYVLSSFVKSFGGEITGVSRVTDDIEKIGQAVKNALEISDVILVSGGSSKGAKDFTIEAIKMQEQSEVLFHGISIKPGKPTIAGFCSGKPVFGLPGHPVAAIMVFKLLVEYCLNTTTGIKDKTVKIDCILDGNVHSDPGKKTFILVKIKELDDGNIQAVPIHGKSGLISLLTGSDGYIEIDDSCEGLYDKQKVKVTLF